MVDKILFGDQFIAIIMFSSFAKQGETRYTKFWTLPLPYLKTAATSA